MVGETAQRFVRSTEAPNSPAACRNAQNLKQHLIMSEITKEQQKKISLAFRIPAYIFTSVNKDRPGQLGLINIAKLISECKGRVILKEVKILAGLIDYAEELMAALKITDAQANKIIEDNGPIGYRDALSIIENDVYLSFNFPKIKPETKERILQRVTEFDTPMNEKVTVKYNSEKRKLEVTVE